jgi:hypothetical protein
MRQNNVLLFPRQFMSVTLLELHVSNYKNTDWPSIDPRWGVSKQDAFELLYDRLSGLIGESDTEVLLSRQGLKRQLSALLKARNTKGMVA